ncbi:hypothetical protein [Halorubrum sp. Boch-26]|nr:hypothetical protein [Halorubrum sp. Boch-26]
MSAVPMAGTGAGPRPDPTTFTSRATDRYATGRHTADRFTDDDTAE